MSDILCRTSRKYLTLVSGFTRASRRSLAVRSSPTCTLLSLSVLCFYSKQPLPRQYLIHVILAQCLVCLLMIRFKGGLIYSLLADLPSNCKLKGPLYLTAPPASPPSQASTFHLDDSKPFSTSPEACKTVFGQEAYHIEPPTVVCYVALDRFLEINHSSRSAFLRQKIGNRHGMWVITPCCG